MPLQEPKLAAEELTFAVDRLGLRGAMVDPNALGRPLGDRAFDPLWRAAADLGAPVILHPFLLEAVERFGRHYLHNLVGYPFETTLAAASLILGGTLDRFPELDVVLVHGGGFLPYQIGRFDRGHAGREEVRADGAARPSGYLRRFHYDTLVQWPRALAYLVDVVGADRVLLGSELRLLERQRGKTEMRAAGFGERHGQRLVLKPAPCRADVGRQRVTADVHQRSEDRRVDPLRFEKHEVTPDRVQRLEQRTRRRLAADLKVETRTVVEHAHPVPLGRLPRLVDRVWRKEMEVDVDDHDRAIFRAAARAAVTMFL